VEFKKSNVYMNRIKTKALTQITIDEDKNVPDSCKDMEQIVLDKATIRIEEHKILEDKVKFHGKLNYCILYSTKEEGTLENITGEIDFDEIVNIEGVTSQDKIQIYWEMEDFRTEIINSRKLNVKAILTFTVTVYQLVSRSLIVDVSATEEFDCLHTNLELLQTEVQKRDVFRIKEDIEIPSTKPNMSALLFKNVQLTGCTIKALDGELSLRGSLQLFVVYSGEENHIPIQWFEKQIEFNGKIEVEESREEMIAWVETSLQNQEIYITTDYDGENRVVSVEVALSLDIMLYEETHLQVLEDVYSPAFEMNTQREWEVFEKLHVRNSSRFKLSERIALETGEKILQICHCDGSIKIDEATMVAEGIQLEGVLCVSMLYICSDDKMPFRQKKEVFPFSYLAQAEGILETSVYQIRPEIEQLSGIMTDSEEVEMKATIVVDLLILEQKKEHLLTNIEIAPLPLEKMEQMPGIIGYIVKPEDSLWSIAKKFYASVNLMREINGLQDDRLQTGQRLLIVKAAEELL
jgi:hypothetical protein